MSIVQRHGLGRTVTALARISTAAELGDPAAASAAFVGADSFRVLQGFNVENTEAREPRADARQSRGLRQRLQRRENTNLTFQTYLSLSGAVIPENNIPLRCAFGAEDFTAGVTTFSLARNPPPANFLFESEGVLGEGVYGWVCDTLRLSMPNGEEPRFEFSGPAQRNLSVGPALIPAAVSTGTVFTLDRAGDAQAYPVGARVKFEGNLGTSTGHRVTANDPSAGTVTVTPAVATAVGDAGTVFLRPDNVFDESALTASDELAFLGGSVLTIDGNVFDYESAEITMENTVELKETAGSLVVTDFCFGFRFVNLSLTMFADEATSLRRALSKNFIGAVAGNAEFPVTFVYGRGGTGEPRATINMPRCQMDRGAWDIAEDGIGRVTLPLVAMAPSDLTLPDDEITLTYDVS